MDPTIEALTIYPAAWAALLQGLVEGVAYGAAVVASVLVVTVVLIACLGGRKQAEEALDGPAEQVVAPVAEPGLGTAAVFSAPLDPGVVVPMVWEPRRVHATRRPRRVCQRASGQWSVVARQPESVG